MLHDCLEIYYFKETFFFKYTVGNFYHNFPKDVTGVLFSYSFVKLKWNFR